MPQALGGLGSVFSGMGNVPTWMKVILGGLTGAGEIGNILAGRERSGIMSRLQKAEKAQTALTPEQLSSLVRRSTQPLQTGLTEAVGNLVQGELGERGLSQAPGIYANVLSQSLAPYYQQNQQQALQQVLYQLGIPLQYAREELGALPGQTDISPLLMLLMASLSKAAPATVPSGGGGGGGTTDTSGIGLPGTSPTPTGDNTPAWFDPIWGSGGLTPAPAGAGT